MATNGGMWERILNGPDLLRSQLLVSSLGPVAGGYFGDLFFDLGEKRGMFKSDFSPQALNIMKEMVKQDIGKTKKNSGSINPKNTKLMGMFAPKNSNFMERHITSPYAEVANALGKFDYKINKEGDLIIEDKGYDWQHKLANEDWFTPTKGTATTGGKVKQFASKLAYETTGTKEGESIPYNFNLGKLK